MKTSENNLIANLMTLLSKNKVPKKSTGGSVLAALSTLIPVVGPAVAPMISTIDQANDADLLKRQQNDMASAAQQPNLNKNMFGNYATGGPTLKPAIVNEGSTSMKLNPMQNVLDTNGFPKFNAYSQQDLNIANNVNDQLDIMHNTVMNDSVSGKIKSNVPMFREKAMGGLITSHFKQYDVGSHATGNDRNINEGGVPSNNNSTAAIQNKENSYTQKGQTYIYSDTLPNPETGNMINKDAALLNKKYKNADKFTEERNALDFTMERLSKVNDVMRNAKEMVDKACGGLTKKMPTGGPVVPPSENLAWQAQNPYEYKVDPPLPILPTVTEKRYGTQGMIEANQMVGDGTLATDTTSFGTELNSLGADQNTVTSPVSNLSPLSNKSKSSFDYNIPAVMLKGLALSKSISDALTPAEKENTILPDYRKADNQMYSTNIDYTQAKQDAMGISNLNSNMNRSASSNFSQFQARQSANFANLADNVGNISMKENLDRNQQRTQRAGYEQGKALDTANREGQNRINNQMNQANADFADQKLFSEVADIGTQFNKYEQYKDMVTNKKEIAQATINEGLQLIGNKNSNFGFSDDFMEKIKSGTASIDEMVKFISTTESIKAKK